MKRDIQKAGNIYPMPVLMIATYNDDGSVNVMNAAWGTMQSGDHVALKLSEGHRTTKNIQKRGAFTVSFATADRVKEADFVGLVSGNDVADKFEKTGLTAEKATKVDAPRIEEFPLCLECELVEYQDGDYGMGVIGKVVNTAVDESLLDGDTIAMEKMGAILFDPFSLAYYRIGEKVAPAFRVGKELK